MTIENQQKALKKREAYATFEKAVLDLYERNSLSLNQLESIASQYQYVEVDSAGSQHRLTHDEKDILQVCIELEDPSFPIPARGSNEDHEEYWEKELKKWEDIVRRRWGWDAYNVSGTSLQPPERAG